MNLFVLDESPTVSAHHHCNKHIVKMTIEVAQMICAAMQFRGLTYKKYPTEQIEWDIGTVGYRKTHVNHPATIWVRQTDENLLWTWTHFEALCDEFQKRYNKVHMTARKLRHMATYAPIPFTADFTKHTPFAQCMPEKYKLSNDAVAAYRNYYIHEKKFVVWSQTAQPEWYKTTI